MNQLLNNTELTQEQLEVMKEDAYLVDSGLLDEALSKLKD